MIKRMIALALSLTLTASMIGCGIQNTIAVLLTSVGIAGASYATAKGDTKDASIITTVYQSGTQVALNWKPGDPWTNVINSTEALQVAIEPILNLDPQDKAETDAIVAGVLGILALIPKLSDEGLTLSPALQARVHGILPKNEKQFKAQWEAAKKAHPVAGLKPL